MESVYQDSLRILLYAAGSLLLCFRNELEKAEFLLTTVSIILCFIHYSKMQTATLNEELYSFLWWTD